MATLRTTQFKVNTEVEIYLNNLYIGTYRVARGGLLQVSLPYDNGEVFTLKGTDINDKPFVTNITISDTTASSAKAELLGITDDTGTPGDFITNDNQLIFNGHITGPVEAGDKVQISLGNGVWKDAILNADGTWRLDNQGTVIPDGTYQLQVRVIDKAGNVDTNNITTQTLVIDTKASTSVAELTAITEDSGVVGDFITNDTELVFSGVINGTLAAGDKVQISIDGGDWKDVIVTGNNWSFDHSKVKLSDGTHSIETRIVDAAGNISTPVAKEITVDTDRKSVV